MITKHFQPTGKGGVWSNGKWIGKVHAGDLYNNQWTLCGRAMWGIPSSLWEEVESPLTCSKCLAKMKGK